MLLAHVRDDTEVFRESDLLYDVEVCEGRERRWIAKTFTKPHGPIFESIPVSQGGGPSVLSSSDAILVGWILKAVETLLSWVGASSLI